VKVILAVFLPPLAIVGMVIAIVENDCIPNLAYCI
jgi:hypothetical protein